MTNLPLKELLMPISPDVQAQNQAAVQALLKQLRDWQMLKPYECKALRDEPGVHIFSLFAVGKISVDEYSLDDRTLALIQYAVQESIAAKRWGWKLNASGIATIVNSFNRELAGLRRDNVAIALLSAYISALGGGE